MESAGFPHTQHLPPKYQILASTWRAVAEPTFSRREAIRTCRSTVRDQRRCSLSSLSGRQLVPGLTEWTIAK
jgi:hypothetical protein